MATQQQYPLLTAKEFLQIDFGERKAELDNGVIRIMAGGTARLAQVQGNIFISLTTRLRGSGYAAYGSDMATQTHDRSVRHPDVSVFCNRGSPSHDDEKAFGDPRLIFEVLSAGTARTDLRVKLDEYKQLPSLDTIVFIDIALEKVRVVQRTGPRGWNDQEYDAPVSVSLPTLGITIPQDEIFARS